MRVRAQCGQSLDFCLGRPWAGKPAMPGYKSHPLNPELIGGVVLNYCVCVICEAARENWYSDHFETEVWSHSSLLRSIRWLPIFQSKNHNPHKGLKGPCELTLLAAPLRSSPAPSSSLFTHPASEVPNLKIFCQDPSSLGLSVAYPLTSFRSLLKFHLMLRASPHQITEYSPLSKPDTPFPPPSFIFSTAPMTT